MILKVNLEDLPDDQKVLIEQAAEEFREKCLLSYSRTRNSVVHKTSLPSVLLHGQSEDVEARTTAHLVYKTIHEAFTNHNKVLANTIGNVLKEFFFEAPVDQVGLAYSNCFNPSAMGSNIPGTVSSRMVGSSNSHQYNNFWEDRLKIRPCKQQGGKVKPYQRLGGKLR